VKEHPMEQRTFGVDRFQVSVLSLGCWMFGWQVDEQSSLKIISAAIDRGINLLDTANIYGQGASESIIGKAIRGRRNRIYIATKVYGKMDDATFGRGLSRAQVLSACDASLRRLGTDYIDLYQLHRRDDHIPIEETLQTLGELMKAGKVRAIGTSTFSATQIRLAQEKAEELGLALTSEQPPYSLLERDVEREVLPVCLKWKIAILPWSPLAGGLLTGKYNSRRRPPHGSRFERWKRDMSLYKQALERVEELKHLSKPLKIPLAHLALAWLRQRPGVTSIIIGPRTLAQLDDYVASLEVEVSREVAVQIDSIIPAGESVLNLYRE
jgi:aryl-alcohol dehydrogenase-like predicted oxidoreductase